jgi:putative exporter of polyketide antibiotics
VYGFLGPTAPARRRRSGSCWPAAADRRNRGVAFLWELLGGILGAPGWLGSVSPFHHVTQVPRVAADVQSTVVMLVVAALAVGAAIDRFTRRDIQTG